MSLKRALSVSSSEQRIGCPSVYHTAGGQHDSRLYSSLSLPRSALLTGTAAAATADLSSELSEWLAEMELEDFMPALQSAGVKSKKDLQFAVTDDFLSADELSEQGFTKLRISRLMKAASKVSRRG